MLSLRLLLLFAVLIQFSINAHARWGTDADAPVEIITYNRAIHVNKDGTAKETIEARVKIKNEVGKERFATYLMHYNTGISKVQVLEAKSINQGQEIPVDLSTIEDKSMASSPQGFDDSHQIMIVFPKIDIGSELYLKYTEEINSPPLKNFFETFFYYGGDGIWLDSNVSIVSEIPFFIDINDPHGVLDVKQYSQNNLYNLDLKLTKPIFSQIFNETNAQIDPKHLTYVHLSTIKSWSDFAQKTRTDYTDILKQPLPELYQEIAEQAKKEKSILSKINTITTKLADKVRYMGDWRSISGRFVPRNLEDVAQSEYGDCKDFAAAVAVILRSLGIEAHLATVSRGSWVYENPSRLAGFRAFNHMITLVKHDKENIWVDPTNITSKAGHIFFDISNRKALVVSSDNSSMEFIPATDYDNYVTEIIQTIDLSNPKQYKVSGELFYRQDAAEPLTAAEIFASQESIEHVIYSQVGDIRKMQDKNISLPRLNTRIVEDLHFSYSFSERSSTVNTNAGQGIMLPTYSLDTYIAEITRVSDLFMGEPRTINSKKLFTNIFTEHRKPIDINIESPWLSVNRKIRYNKTSISVHDLVKIKKSLITNEDIQGQEYKQLSANIEKYFSHGSAIIFNRLNETDDANAKTI